MSDKTNRRLIDGLEYPSIDEAYAKWGMEGAKLVKIIISLEADAKRWQEVCRACEAERAKQ